MTHSLNFSNFLQDQLRQPVFANLLASRPACAGILGFLVAHGLLVAADLPSYECPLLATTGVPCPGCGLSRGIRAFVIGDWSGTITYHALAPFFLVGLIIMMLITLAPKSARSWSIGLIERVELRTGFSSVFLIGLVLYWLGRLIVLQGTYISLMANY